MNHSTPTRKREGPRDIVRDVKGLNIFIQIHGAIFPKQVEFRSAFPGQDDRITVPNDTTFHFYSEPATPAWTCKAVDITRRSICDKIIRYNGSTTGINFSVSSGDIPNFVLQPNDENTWTNGVELCTDSLAGQDDLFSGHLKPLVNVQTLVEKFGRTNKALTLNELLSAINPVVQFYRNVAKEVKVPSRVNYHCNFCQTVWPMPGAQFSNATIGVGTVKEIWIDKMTFTYPWKDGSSILNTYTVGLPSLFVGETNDPSLGKLDFSDSVPDFWKKQREEAARADVSLLKLQIKKQTPLRFSHVEKADWLNVYTDKEKVELLEEMKHYKNQYLKNEPFNRLADVDGLNWQMEVMNYLTRIKSIQNYETKARERKRRTLEDVVLPMDVDGNSSGDDRQSALAHAFVSPGRGAEEVENNLGRNRGQFLAEAAEGEGPSHVQFREWGDPNLI